MCLILLIIIALSFLGGLFIGLGWSKFRLLEKEFDLKFCRKENGNNT